jgi:hypothetical protein
MMRRQYPQVPRDARAKRSNDWRVTRCCCSSVIDAASSPGLRKSDRASSERSGSDHGDKATEYPDSLGR